MQLTSHMCGISFKKNLNCAASTISQQLFLLRLSIRSHTHINLVRESLYSNIIVRYNDGSHDDVFGPGSAKRFTQGKNGEGYLFRYFNKKNLPILRFLIVERYHFM